MTKKNPIKILCVAGICVAVAPAAFGSIVKAITIPAGGLKPPSSAPSTTFWDVNGDGVNEFALNHWLFSSVNLQTFSEVNTLAGDNALVILAGATRGFAKLDVGESIGATLASTFKYYTDSWSYDYNPIYLGAVLDINAITGGWSEGDTGFFGFRFISSPKSDDFFGYGPDEIHYGWGKMVLGDGTFTITEAWYEDSAEVSIEVGAVPEPAEFGLGLGALALGVAGLRRSRQRRTVPLAFFS